MPVFLSAECADGVLELATPSGSLLLASAVLLSFCKFWYRCNRGRISDANFLNRRHSVAWRALPSARTWPNTGQGEDRDVGFLRLFFPFWAFEGYFFW